MSGREKGVGRGFGIGADGAQDGRNQELRDEEADVGKSALLGQIGQHGVGGNGGFEADGQMDDLLVRVLLGEVEGLEGGADHADIAAAGLGGIEIAGGIGGHAQEVAEGAENGVGAAGDGDGMVEIGRRA